LNAQRGESFQARAKLLDDAAKTKPWNSAWTVLPGDGTG